ncbi:MAG: hypothetical protein HQL57_06730 [Magnetococcales bacterium]|nr:hypothetical protein [Magnetococcales bacterium]
MKSFLSNQKVHSRVRKKPAPVPEVENSVLARRGHARGRVSSSFGGLIRELARAGVFLLAGSVLVLRGGGSRILAWLGAGWHALFSSRKRLRDGGAGLTGFGDSREFPGGRERVAAADWVAGGVGRALAGDIESAKVAALEEEEEGLPREELDDQAAALRARLEKTGGRA